MRGTLFIIPNAKATTMRHILSTVILFLLMASSPAWAQSLTVTIGDLSLSPGETKPLDVWISGDGTVPLGAFDLEFHISTSGARQLWFVDPSTVTNGLAFLTDPNYILSGHESLGFMGTVGSVESAGPNDKFNGSDGLTGATDSVTVGGAPKLLTRLWVTADTYLPPAGTGDLADRTFTVSLYDDPNFTAFRDASFTTTYDYNNSTVGTITVVPEPATVIGLIGGGACLAGLFGYRGLRRRWGTSEDPPEPFFDEQAERE